MKAWEIFKRDIKNISKSYSAIIIVVALCILPSLYAWFNIKASWDPYSQEATSGIKIAVVNKDKGTTLNGEELNLGNKVIEGLHDNKQMGWQFLNEEEAIKKIDDGSVFAMITIPEGFSNDLTSIITKDVRKGQIEYTVNEKINAIAPKITDKGASGVQEKISKELVSTVSDAILEAAKEVGISLESELPKISTIYNTLVEIQSHFDEINSTVDKTSDGAEKIKTLIEELQNDMPLIEETITNAKDLSLELEDFITNSKDSVQQIAPIIKNDISIINGVASQIADHAEAIKVAIEEGSDKLPEMVDNLKSKLTLIEDEVDGLIKILEKLNNISVNKPYTDLIDKLTGIRDTIVTVNGALDQVNGNGTVDLPILDKVITVASDVTNITQQVYDNFDSEIVGKINSIFDDAYTVAENVLQVLKTAEEKLPVVNDILSDAQGIVNKGIQGIAFVDEKLPKAEEVINNLVSKLKEVNNNEELKQVIDLLKQDVAERSDFLANPVEMVENKLYPMGNYGTSMTPFYTVLCLWVGLMLLSSVFTVEVKGDYSPASQYWGKLMLFMSMAIIQGLIVALGDLYLLKIHCQNPALFVVGTIFTSVVFTFIVYSLVSVLGNVGKAAGIILLVLQVAGSGGTFPIQLTPKFFQGLYPYLPFTYAVSFAREAIGGVVNSVLVKDIIVLCAFSIIFVLIAIFLKKPIGKVLHKFNENFEKSGIGE